MEEEESFWLFLSLAPAPSLTSGPGRAGRYQMLPGNVHPLGLAPATCILSVLLPATRSGGAGCQPALPAAVACVSRCRESAGACRLSSSGANSVFELQIFLGGGEPLGAAMGRVLGRQLSLPLCAWGCPGAAGTARE